MSCLSRQALATTPQSRQGAGVHQGGLSPYHILWLQWLSCPGERGLTGSSAQTGSSRRVINHVTNEDLIISPRTRGCSNPLPHSEVGQSMTHTDASREDGSREGGVVNT